MLKRIIPLTLMFVVGLAGLSTLLAPPIASAQGRPTPTPVVTATPTSAPGGKKKTAEKESPPPLEGAVYGYVYDYSSGGVSPGVTVVIDGGGWQAEAVTNSEGYYVFAGLGSGSAVVNLKLPPGAKSTMPDWPVHTGSSQPDATNIGFYWGENPPIPVALTMAETTIVPASQPFNINLQVSNNSGGEATNGLIEVKLPALVSVQNATASRGAVDYSAHAVWVNIASLATGETVDLAIEANFNEDSSGQNLPGQAAFTYDEQITPQLIKFNIAGSTAVTEEGEKENAVMTTDSDSEKPGKTETLIPTTGGPTDVTGTTWLGIVMSLLFIIGLAFAGLRTFSKRA